MKKTKIVFIGAVSVCFGKGFFNDIFRSGELHGSTLSLVDIDKENLDKMYNFAVKINEITGAGMKIERTTERRDVLSGAEFVVNSAAIDRINLWQHDFDIPKKHGIRQIMAENGGPGALFHGMRTLPMILDFARDMEDLCPNAYFLNFSNPESRVILALARYTKIKSLGLCHGIYFMPEIIGNIIGMNEGEIEVWGAGLNHFQWLLEIKDKNGRDLYPLLREKNKSFDPDYEPLSRKMFEVFGLYPTCGDSHTGEYVAYGYEGGDDDIDFSDYNEEVEEQARDVADITSGKKELELWESGERAVDAITAILYNKKEFIDAGIVYNNGAISNLPDDAAVEVPVMIDGTGIHPVTVGALPAGIARVLSQQICVQQAAVEAAAHGCKELAMQALLLDPVVNSTDAAKKILDELWEINKPYIKNCL
jgi:alpha-galactosidase